MEADDKSKCVIGQWWSTRFPVAGASFQSLAKKKVPIHKLSFAYFLGGMTLTALIVQVITGILLLLYYQPTTIEANASVEFISRTVPGGLFIKSLHQWAASAIVLLVFFHAVSVALMRAYRRPRELTWMTGALSLLIILGLAFSGYLLPWNTLSVYATKVGVQVMQTSTVGLPGLLAGLGSAVAGLLTGPGGVGQQTLTRFFALHVVILPLSLLLLLLVHLLLVQLHGMSVPPSIQHKEVGEQVDAAPFPGRWNDSWPGKAESFFPKVLLKDLATWLLILGGLCILAEVLPYDYFLPYTLARAYDPLASAPVGIRPEWCFFFLYYPLEMLPREFVIVAAGLLTICFLAMPWIMNSVPRLWGSSLERSSFPIWCVAVTGLAVLVLTIFGADLVHMVRGVAP